MSKKHITFPLEVPSDSVVVKIYRVKNKAYLVRASQDEVQKKERFSFMVSYFAKGKRTMKMFAKFEKAYAHAKTVGTNISNGDLDVLELRSDDCRAYRRALAALQPIGVPFELAAIDYAEAWKVLGGRASLLEAAKEFARRHMHELPDKLLPDAVKEMLAAMEREHTSLAYMKVLRFYLGQLSESFNCQLRSVTTAQISDFLRNMDVSGRTKNNARATVGAFFKYCKERGWLPKDHEGISMVPKFKVKQNDIEIFSVWEMAQFFSFSRPELIPFLAIGAFAGLRSAEIDRLDWSEVRLADRFIEVKAAKAKTASRRLVPISDNLAKWLAPHVKESGRVMPFDNQAKQIAWLIQDTNAGLKAAAKEAGKDPAKTKTVKWKKNALRHSYISYRLADVQDAPKVALEAGNSPQMIFAHYRELVRPADAKAWFSIAPGKDGKIITFDSPKDSARRADLPEPVVPEQQSLKNGLAG